MRSYTLLILSLLLTTLLFLNFRCYKESDFKLSHFYRVLVDVRNQQKNYHVNDTIWMQLEANGRLLYDTISRTSISVTNGFDFATTSYKIGELPSDSAKGSLFDIISDRGINTNRETYNQTTRFHLSKLGCAQNTFAMTYGFVPKHTGVYALILNERTVLQSCSGSASYTQEIVGLEFKPADLNADVLNSYSGTVGMSAADRSQWQTLIDGKRAFIFRVN